MTMMNKLLSQLLLSHKGTALLVCALSLFLAKPLYGEIQWVSIQWTAGLCRESCVKGLNGQFSRIDGVSEIRINQDAGQATLIWKPNAPFLYTQVRNAMAMIGLYVRSMRIKVRGTLIHDRNTVVLVSLGDNTRFVLRGPITPSPDRMVQKYSMYSHPLSAELSGELLDVERAKKLIIIEGPLFEPERAPPLQLIVERKQVVEPETRPE